MSGFVDILGQPIQTGDYVMYAAGMGQCNVMKAAVVTGLVLKEDERYTGKGVEKYETPTLRVITAELHSDWDRGTYKGPKWELQGAQRSSKKPYAILTLTFLNRLVVVPADRLPEQLRTLLSGAYAAECPKPAPPEYGDRCGGVIF